MDVKEFLKTNPDINLASIASKMWPTNKSAKTYLSRKLSGEGDRPWTDKDSAKAKEVLKQLSDEIQRLLK
ncbi:hypothetical protein FKG96_12300 [Olivibacter sp. LS-1]|uniref:hypothetical protein n=1 Tax=Olivibacter sp. LS-1 TaxID=2592345 RepID=UPI0011EB6FDF|nr:hypothetical protein [Olivibacter sp. LS-1]QEL01553.1 hypothetical protein FKG96_12300 [Olivibacter sp. LS-1]